MYLFNISKYILLLLLSIDLHDGISINRRNGIISGSSKEISEITYEITCNSPNNTKVFKMKISIGILTHFSYPKPIFSYIINEEISIKPKCDGDYCIFKMYGVLADGLRFDSKSGIISGTVSIVLSCKDIVIVCKSPTGKVLQAILDINIGTITRFFYLKSEIHLKLNEDVLIKPIYDGNNVHFKTNDSIYIFIYNIFIIIIIM